VRHTCAWALALAALLLAPVAWGAAAKPPKPKAAPAGKIVIKSNGPSEGPLRGPWQWTKGVTVTSEGLTLTCDTLTAWPGKNGRDFDRIEAVGSVHVTGLYTASDQSKWDVDARAKHATLDNTTGLGTLTGDVNVHGVNTVDKSAFSALADTFTYNRKTQFFRFEHVGEQVQVEFQPAPPAPKPAPKAAATHFPVPDPTPGGPAAP